MNGDAYAMGIAIATYEWTAAIALIVVGKFYFRLFKTEGIYNASTSVQRYDQTVSTMLAILMLIMYVMVILPTILWLGQSGKQSYGT